MHTGGELVGTMTLSVRMPEDLAQQLNRLAEASQRSKSFCIVEAVKAYLEREAWQLQAIETGLDDLENGRLIDHDAVKTWVDSWDTQNESGKPECG